MIEARLRPLLQAWCIDPLARRLLSHISPITVTWIGLALGILAALVLVWGHSVAAVALLLTSGLCDVLDGTLARNSPKGATPAGAVLDIVSDRAVEFAVIAALAASGPDRAYTALWMVGSVLLCVTSFLVVGIFTPNESAKGFHYSRGLVERAEAFVFFSAMMLFPQVFFPLAWTFITLVFATAAIRVAQFLRQA